MKQKILFIHHGTGIGGAPLSLLYLIQSLDKSKFEAVVLFLRYSEIVELYKQNGIHIAGIVNLYDFSHTKVWWFRWYHIIPLYRSLVDTIKTFWFVADNWLDKIRPDIVHLNTSSLVAWGKVACKKNIPVIWHIREPLADGYIGIRKYLIKNCVEKYSSMILPICKSDAKPWLRCSKTHIVYNAVDSKKFDFHISPNNFLIQHKINPEPPKILFLGGLSPEKGTDIILNAFFHLLKKLPQAQLLIAGYFDQDLKYATFTKKRFPVYRFKKSVLELYDKIKSNVALLGPINYVPAAIAAVEVVVFPANFGHFARPVIESGFMKKPVIASNFAPLDELVIDGITGYLINHKNIKEWTEKMYLLLIDKALNKSMGEAGYRFCKSNFDLKKQALVMQKIYEMV